jgi:hypothetical protein
MTRPDGGAASAVAFRGDTKRRAPEAMDRRCDPRDAAPAAAASQAVAPGEAGNPPGDNTIPRDGVSLTEDGGCAVPRASGETRFGCACNESRSRPAQRTGKKPETRSAAPCLAKMPPTERHVARVLSTARSASARMQDQDVAPGGAPSPSFFQTRDETGSGAPAPSNNRGDDARLHACSDNDARLHAR